MNYSSTQPSPITQTKSEYHAKSNTKLTLIRNNKLRQLTIALVAYPKRQGGWDLVMARDYDI